jgi:hypothetical protein
MISIWVFGTSYCTSKTQICNKYILEATNSICFYRHFFFALHTLYIILTINKFARYVRSRGVVCGFHICFTCAEKSFMLDNATLLKCNKNTFLLEVLITEIFSKNIADSNCCNYY